MVQGRRHRDCGDTWRGPGAQPHLSRNFCLFFPHPREILGLVDMVALENGELGPLLSTGTLRGLEDECVTDVKVPNGLWSSQGAWQVPLPASGSISLSLW